MTSPPPDLEQQPQRFPLRGAGAVSLHQSGVRHPRSRLGGDVFTPYGEVIHLARGPRMLDIATQRGSYFLWRSNFRDADAPEQLARALRERIAAQPGGAAQLARMLDLDRLFRDAPAPRAFLVLPLLCLVVAVLEQWVGVEVSIAGFFSSTLVEAGERWRIVTANWLHGGLTHLMLNVMGLLALGGLVERVLGAARYWLVVGASVLGAMGTGWWVGYEYAVGVSGVVSGLAGSLVWLELRRAERLPAPWRLPRRWLLLLVGAELLLSLVVPAIAAAAHLGGFAAGALATALAGGPNPREQAAPFPVRAAAAVFGGILLACTAVGAWQVIDGGAALARSALRLEAQQELAPTVLNNYAWMIATSHRSTDPALAVAERLAREAVDQTARRDPNVLDTLAEVLFARGRVEQAVETIDEAIELSPAEPYFQEQRRRFLGEREAGDRPPPPPEVPQPRRAPRPSQPQTGPGLTV